MQSIATKFILMVYADALNTSPLSYHALTTQ